MAWPPLLAASASTDDDAEHDALHRLTGSSGLAAGSTAYQYDLDGNRTRRFQAGVTTDYQYDRADQLQQQTIGVTTRSFDYDRFGNLTSAWDSASAQTTYAYDEASRLTLAAARAAATELAWIARYVSCVIVE